MDYKELIHRLVNELSFRVGIPDLESKEQQTIVSEILSEWGNLDEKKIIMEFLTEAEPEKSAEDEKYKNTGGSGYVKASEYDKWKSNPKGDFEKFTKGPSGKYVPQVDKEQEGEKEEKEQGTALNDKSYKKIVSKEKETQKKIDDENNDGVKPKVNNSKVTKEEKTQLLQKDHDKTDEQLYMTKSEASAQSKSKDKKDVGAGTAESRAGEAMVHKGLRLLKEGKSLEEVENTFKTLVSDKNHILATKTGVKWVGASMASLRKMDEVVGIDNIEDVAWDTADGRTAIGVDPKLETSSDAFIRTKDGKNIGVSLKKDGSVFLNNGGWAKQSTLLLNKLKSEMPEEDHKRLSSAMSIEAYKEDLDKRFAETTNNVSIKQIEESFERLKNNPQDQDGFSGSNRERYFKILSNPELLTKKIKLGTAIGIEQKAYAKLLQTYHKEEYKHLRESDNGLTQRAFQAINESESAKAGMNKHIIKSMHISETLGLNPTIKEGGVDGFLTLYGIEPDGAILDEPSLVTLFGSKFKQKLDEVVTEIRNGGSSYSELEDFIVDSIEIDYESGQILFKHESNKKFPLFKMAGRTRGIGSSPVMEMSQTPFMAHALKMGTFNTDEWDEKSLQKFKKDIQDSEQNS